MKNLRKILTYLGIVIFMRKRYIELLLKVINQILEKFILNIDQTVFSFNRFEIEYVDYL